MFGGFFYPPKVRDLLKLSAPAALWILFIKITPPSPSRVLTKPSYLQSEQRWWEPAKCDWVTVTAVSSQRVTLRRDHFTSWLFVSTVLGDYAALWPFPRSKLSLMHLNLSPYFADANWAYCRRAWISLSYLFTGVMTAYCDGQSTGLVSCISGQCVHVTCGADRQLRSCRWCETGPNSVNRKAGSVANQEPQIRFGFSTRPPTSWPVFKPQNDLISNYFIKGFTHVWSQSCWSWQFPLTQNFDP